MPRERMMMHRTRRGSLRILQSGISGGAVYGAAGELRTPASDAADGEWRGVWRLREIFKFCVYGKCGTGQRGGIAAAFDGTGCSDGSEIEGSGDSRREGFVGSGRRFRYDR